MKTTLVPWIEWGSYKCHLFSFLVLLRSSLKAILQPRGFFLLFFFLSFRGGVGVCVCVGGGGGGRGEVVVEEGTGVA